MTEKWLILLLGLLWTPGLGNGFQLSTLTSLFQVNPEGYDKNWNPETVKEYASKISMSINHGCPYTDCSLHNGTVGITVANISISDDPQQEYEYHWLWSVIGHPAIQAAITQQNSLLKIDWSAIFGLGGAGHAIGYQPVPPFYSAAIMISKLIEFNDTDNSGRLDSKVNQQFVRTYDLIHFDWRRMVMENSTDRMAIGLVTQKYNSSGGGGIYNEGEDETPQVLGGRINLTLAAYSTDGFGHWLPHLSHSRKTNQFDIQLQDIQTNSGFNCSRFALELVLVSNNERPSAATTSSSTQKEGSENPDDVTRQKTTTLDDEHTPGIFTTEELILPGVNDTLKSYMQWRPIAYSTMERELSSSTGLHVLPAVDVDKAASVYNNSMLYVLYGMDLDDIVVKAVNVSFGVKDDGFYKKTKYVAWTFTFGTGNPIRNGLSSKIILAIIVLVLVTVITCGVGLGFCLHNRAKHNKQQQQQNDDSNNGYTRMRDENDDDDDQQQQSSSN